MTSYCNETTLTQFPNELWNYTLGSTTALISVLAIFENGILMVVFVKYPSIRSPSHKIIMSLVVLDLLTGLTVSPLYTAQLLNSEFGYNCTGQTIRRLLATVILGASLATVGFISVDRAHHLIKLQNYRMKDGIIRIIIGLCWSIPILIVIVGIFSDDKIYAALVFVFIVVAITAVLGSYVTLIVAIRKHQNTTTLNNDHYKRNQIVAAKTAILIVTFHILMIFPLLIEKILYAFMFQFDSQFERPVLLIMGVVVCLANSAINPFIYCARIPAIRKDLRRFRRELVSGTTVSTRQVRSENNIATLKSTRL